MSHPSVEPLHRLAQLFDTDVEVGLTTDEAASRLKRDGWNILQAKPAVPVWRRFIAQFQDPLVYLLFVAIGISLAAWVVDGAKGLPVDVIVIAAIVIANALIGFFQENKAANAVEALSKMTAATSTVIRDGSVQSIESKHLVVGDLLTLAEGDAIDADARLVSARGLKVQESALTGESESVVKDPATLDQIEQIGDRKNMVHKGTAVVEGVGRAIVTGVGMNTEMGAIATMLHQTEEEESPLSKQIARVSKMLGLLVIVIAVITMVVLGVASSADSFQELVDVLLFGVSLAVAAVPEGLPAILSLVLAIGVQALARRNAIMKSLDSVETLGCASVIASDKTGTLTRNEMTLSRVVTASGEVTFSGSGYDPNGSIEGSPEAAALAEAEYVISGGSTANNASLSFDDGWTIQGDPTEAAFLVAMHKLPGLADKVLAFERVDEVPFTSERKIMSAAVRSGETYRLFTKGAPDVLLDKCVSLLVGHSTEALTEHSRLKIAADIRRLSAQGFRTLAVAFREIPEATIDESDEQNLVFAGLVAIIDPPRLEAKQAIAQAHRAKIRTLLITGDHPLTAVSIANQLGIIEGQEKALTGADLDELDEDSFYRLVRKTDIYARVGPSHKLRIIDALKSDGNIVAMTGDGVNDAPALKKADIGVAMGITGTEVSKQSANMILADDNYATIVSAIRHGRAIFDNIRKFLRFLLSSNMGEVLTIFVGVVLSGFLGITSHNGGLAVPLLATQILWMNLVTDSAPALAMGVDPTLGDVMSRPPRKPQEPIIDTHMWGRIIFIGIVMCVVTLLTIDIFLPGGLVEGSHSLTVARTAGFTTLVFAQLFNALNSRSDIGSAFCGFFSNQWLWGAIALTVALQIAVVQVPFLQSAFSTASLSLEHWVIAVAMSSVVLWAEEGAKALRRLSRSGIK